MKKNLAVVLLLPLFFLSACTAATQTSAVIQPVAPSTAAIAEATASPSGVTLDQSAAAGGGLTSAAPTAAQPPVGDSQGLPLVSERGELFNGSGNCAVCHTRMTDMGGKDVSTDRLWRATMMANAARDPYWQASVRREILNSPAYQEIIEDKCTTCHMPMASFTAYTKGETGALLDQGMANPAHALHPLAIDGVSCSLCHQVQPDNFAAQESFSGGYAIDTQAPVGERIVYGPYPVGKNLVAIMQGVSGFIPEQGLHIEEAALCGTCHNLFTPYLDANDQVAGEFPEQMVFSEWLHSSYPENKTCQSCHMPEAQGGVQLSTTGGPPRSPFFQHYFVGGNLYLAQLFQEFGAEMGVTASQDQFATTIKNNQELLAQQTASLQVENPTLQDGKLSFDVFLQSQVGHKFPAGYPSRRAWLHVRVVDSSGKVLFESGAAQPNGSIQGNDNDQDGSKFEPHYRLIENPDQVQIYESIMVNSDGVPTTLLMRGAAYVKDNRLLPQGFEKASAPAEIAVNGAALDDEDFLAGGDRLQYLVDLGSTSGPFTIQVELLYQTIAFRWAENIKDVVSAETQRFVDYNTALPNLPFVVAGVQAEVK